MDPSGHVPETVDDASAEADELVAVELGTVEVRLISRLGSAPAGSLDFEVLDGLPMVLPVPGSERREQFDRFFDAFGVRPDPVIESNERAVWIEALAVHRRDGLTHVMELFIDLVRNVVALRA